MAFSKSHSTGFLANHMARLLASCLQEKLRGLGLAPAQFMVLLELWDEDAQTQRQLIGRLDVEQATMANTLARMQRDGLIARHQSKRDGRSKVVFLTQKARLLQGPATQAAQAANKKALAGLGVEEQAKLNELMKTVIASLKRG